ncbi:hypothetical protein [Domibacillus epiphyticus]|uniref:hypothetical protein n=1 Tax=Domibacillus epiphyticus TaxID=1714355 RepID=UPI000977775F|nr:hypothetical protein [Domibacillus epiphyticus]
MATFTNKEKIKNVKRYLKENDGCPTIDIRREAVCIAGADCLMGRLSPARPAQDQPIRLSLYRVL